MRAPCEHLRRLRLFPERVGSGRRPNLLFAAVSPSEARCAQARIAHRAMPSLLATATVLRKERFGPGPVDLYRPLDKHTSKNRPKTSEQVPE